jgi:hypothetical protein
MSKEYRAILKAIIDNAIVDYVKLQHPNNRKKKYLQNAYINSIALLFDDSFKFDFSSQHSGDLLKLEEALTILMDGQLASINKTQQHVLDNTIDYWLNKHFQDLNIPKTINICGNVYFIRYSEVQIAYVDYKNYLIVLIKNNKDNDRFFVNLAFDIILNKTNTTLKEINEIEIKKFLYLFLKMNGCFTSKTEDLDPETLKRIQENE